MTSPVLPLQLVKTDGNLKLEEHPQGRQDEQGLRCRLPQLFSRMFACTQHTITSKRQAALGKEHQRQSLVITGEHRSACGL
jgi:hypothetical protein